MNYLLLTAETVSSNGAISSGDVVTVSAAIIVLAFIAAGITYYLKSKKNDDAALEEFFKTMSNTIKSDILTILAEYTNKDLKGDFNTVYAEVMNKIYGDIYDICLGEIEKALHDNSEALAGMDEVILDVVNKVFTKDKLKKYIDQLIDSDTTIIDRITGIVNTIVEKENAKAEEEDKERTKELEEAGIVEDMDALEESGEVDKEQRETPQLDANFEPIKEEINPPTDEGEKLEEGTFEEVKSEDSNS